MTTTTTHQPYANFGGRTASDTLRASHTLCEQFAGLDEDTDRYALLLLVKRAGKLAGFTPRMIQLLDYYLAYTAEVDWQAGSRPIVFQSLSRTALDLGVSERQIQKLEASLFEAGAITWNDSGNHKRYGRRCPDTNRIVYAYGVDLTPLAFLREELESKLAAKRRDDEAWLGLKRAISAQRRVFRALAAEWQSRGPNVLLSPLLERYDQIAVPIRTHLDRERLEQLLAEHTELVNDLKLAMGLSAEATPSVGTPETRPCSPMSEPEFAHYNYTTQPTKVVCSPGGDGLQAGVADRSRADRPDNERMAATAMEHVSLAMAIGAASEQMREHLPEDAGWSELVEAAYRRRRDLGISQASWGEACRVLGRSGAAVALLVTDRASTREIDPVRTPPAYFRGMVRRGEAGQLRLCRSLFGLLQRDARSETCAV